MGLKPGSDFGFLESEDNTCTCKSLLKPVLQDHPLLPKNGAPQDRWSLVTGSIVLNQIFSFCWNFVESFQDQWSLIALVSRQFTFGL